MPLLKISSLYLLASVLVYTAGAVQTSIPRTSFDSQQEFDKYWNYLYPWGSDHNGSARMDKKQVAISNGTVTLTAKKVSGQRSATHGGKQIAINYLSGAINAKEYFTVTKGGGHDYIAELKATTNRGTWPAFWLTTTQGWTNEVDMAEWKGSGKISFNTYETNSQWQTRDVAYPTPEQFHKFKCEIRDTNGKDVSIKFYMDGSLVTTQVGRSFVGKAVYLVINLQMEGSSGSPGPSGDTEYAIRNLEVLSYNP